MLLTTTGRDGTHGTTGMDVRTRYDQLTRRERELLALMAQGLTNQAIGQMLFLSPKTVETHVRSILGKLVDDRTDGCHRRVTAVLVHLAASGSADDEAPARPAAHPVAA